jgi:hypothetical protein
MFYWLFTGGKALLGGCLAPLLCLAIITPPAIAALLGAGIRRADDKPMPQGLRRVLFLAAYGIVNLGMLTLFVSLFGNFAIARQVGKPIASSLILLLSGAPQGVNPVRLFMMGILLLLACGLASLALHYGLRSGGWLRERVDRLRRPRVRRGAMGSSHFCTFREYRRYRRQDKDGITFLGAFWGEGRRRLDWGKGTF